MKKVFLFAAAMLYGIVQAQTLHVSFSEKFTLQFARYLFDRDGHLYRSGENSYYMNYFSKGASILTAKLFGQRYGIELRRYDKDMKEVVKAEFHPERDLAPFLPSLYLFDGHVLLFYYKPSGEEGIKLYFTELDSLTLTAKEERELYTIPQRNVWGGNKIDGMQQKNQLSFAVNPSGTAMMVSQAGNVSEAFSCIIDRQLQVSGKVITPINTKKVDFTIPSCALDGQGNRYFSCSFIVDNYFRWGVMAMSASGEVSWPGPGSSGEPREPARTGFYISKAGIPYMYGNYGDGRDRERGVMLAKLVNGPNGITLGDAVYAAYPDTLAQKLIRKDYAWKLKGKYYLDDTYYHPTELADASIVLSGYVPDKDDAYTSHGTTREYFAGPIVNVFFKGQESHFGVLYRNHEETQCSGFNTFAYGDKLVVIYNESTGNLASRDPSDLESSASLKSLVPVQATLSQDGRVLQRKPLAEREKGINYCTGLSKLVSDRRIIIPRGEGHGSGHESYIDMSQWVTIDLE